MNRKNNSFPGLIWAMNMFCDLRLMLRLILRLVAPLLCLLWVAPASARDVEGIAAIVNDEVISIYDVDQRVDLFLATSGIEKSADVIERMRAQVLRSLVDEKLQMQEAKRVEIAIEAAEIERRLEGMARDSGMSLDGIKKFLGDNGITVESLKSQIEAELAWNQFVRRSFSGRIKIGDAEINEQYNKAVRAIGQPSYLLSEILLAVDSFADQSRIAALSAEIVSQLQAGVDFGAVARQFSVSPSVARGGQLGWISASQLEPQLAELVARLQVGQISQPIATNAGIYIVALMQKQESGGPDSSKNRFDVLSVTFTPDTKPKRVDRFIADFKTCRRAQQDAKKLDATAKRTGLREIRALPANIRRSVANLEAGQLGAPQSTENGVQLHIVCDRKDDLGIAVSRDAIADNIFSQRIAMMARRHLRDLRRDAVVEYR